MSDQADEERERRAFSALQLAAGALAALVTGAGGGIGLGTTLRGDSGSAAVVLEIREQQRLAAYRLDELSARVERLASQAEQRRDETTSLALVVARQAEADRRLEAIERALQAR